MTPFETKKYILLAGISLATVQDIERGAGNLSMKTVTKILEVLGLEMQFRIRTIE